MSLARRLAQIERRRLDRAVIAFRTTITAYERQLARRREDPEYRARVEAERDALYDTLPPEERRRREDHSERMLAAIRLLAPGSSDEDIDRAVRLLEPVVTPPDSPAYARIGALRRAVASWLTLEDE